MFVSVFSRLKTETAPIRPFIPVILASLFVSGCATLQGVDLPDITDWDNRVEILAGLRRFEFNGRVGVKAGEEGFNGSLRWSQQGDRFKARVSGPLGIGTVRLVGDQGAVELTDKDGVRTTLADAERELYLRYGWTIPVQSLRYWALGIPDPNSQALTEFDEEGRLVQLQQAGWVVDIKSYEEGGGQQMPRRLSASSTDTRVRLVIDDWVFF